jgi:hypothetical protein
MRKICIDPDDLAPAMAGFCFRKIEDVIYLGKAQVEALAGYHQEWMDSYAAEAEGLEKFIKTVSDKKSFESFARRYADPKSEEEMRELTCPKATTCNRCGLCKYIDNDPHWSSGGYKSFICRIEDRSMAREFFSPCFLKDVKSSSFRTVVGKVAEHLEDLMKQGKQAARRRDILLYLAKFSEEKPVWPKWRPDNWFKSGDKVVILSGEEFKNLKVEEVRGGMVYIGGEGGRFSYEYKCKDLMLEWEFEYLMRDREFMEWYLRFERAQSRIFEKTLDQGLKGKKKGWKWW